MKKFKRNLEYQTLYSFKTKNYINKYIDNIIKTVNNKIEKEIINYSIDTEGNILLNNATTTYITNCKAKIYEMEIKVWDVLEDIIE